MRPAPSIEDYWTDFLSEMAKFEAPQSNLCMQLIEEALACYQASAYNASVMLCRTSVDSALYLGCVWKKATGGLADYEERDPFPFGADQSWGLLRSKAQSLKLASSSDLDEVNERVRTKANFAAHLAREQLKAASAYAVKVKPLIEKVFKGEPISLEEKNTGLKIRTSQPEAAKVLIATMDFIKKTVENYQAMS